MNRNRFSIVTLGCKVNQAETAHMRAQLENEGFSYVESWEDADIVIINSCTVTNAAESESLRVTRKIQRRNQKANIILSGCLVNASPQKLRDIQKTCLCIGNYEKLALLPNLLKKNVFNQMFLKDISCETNFFPLIPSIYQNRKRVPLKIQDGCSSYCSYCIVPFTRGTPRSLPEKDVISAINILKSKDVKEIILTGIHIGQYGKDFPYEYDLSCLLARIFSMDEIPRIRLSSLHPDEITLSLLRHIEKEERLSPHIHLSVQSLSDHILSLMGRRYKYKDVISLVEKLKEIRPDTSIGMDIICGFPGETEDDFLMTAKLLKNLPISYLHVFPYSERPGTKAASYKGKVPKEIIKKRVKILRNIGLKKKIDFWQSQINKVTSILVLGKDKRDGFIRGITPNYIPVRLEGDARFIGRDIMVKLITYDNYGTIGIRI